jgi:uncharacterized membrane protein YraQ (UPF0718 family)
MTLFWGSRSKYIRSPKLLLPRIISGKFLLRLKTVFVNTFKTLGMVMPMLLSVIALAGLFETLVTPEMIQSVFKGSIVEDTLMGTGIGAVSVGQPFLSYVIGGELLNEGVSLYAVTAFILSFVTLGVIQVPLEWSLFGTRFTLLRNSLSFIFAFLISIAAVTILGFLQ